MLRRKLISELLPDEDGPSLKRALSLTQLTALGVGCIIGAGIFVLTGSTAAQFAGPGIILSFLLSALGCACCALCYAEFAALVPVAGSAYTYAYASLGEIFAWIIGWDLILEYSFGAAAVAKGWSANLVIVFQKLGFNPDQRVVSFCAVLLMTAILVAGIRQSAGVNGIIVAIKTATVLLFIVVAGAYLLRHPAQAVTNWQPFLPFGWGGVVRGAAVICFAYLGFDAVSTAAQEARNPQRDMPRAIIGSLAICTVLYVFTAALLTGLVPYTELNVSAPIAMGIERTGAAWASFAVPLGTVLGLSTVTLVMLLGQSRVVYAMSRDGLLPSFLGKIHPSLHTPYLATSILGLFVATLSAAVPVTDLVLLANIGTLLAFCIVCGGIIVLRRRDPQLTRPFRTPWVPLVPVVGILVAVSMMASLPAATWLRLLLWQILGLLVYFTYGRRASTKS